MLTPDVVRDLPTKALRDVGSTLEAFAGLIGDLDDMEGFICSLEGGLATAVHVIDAELQERPRLPRVL